MRVAYITLGCKVNQTETAAIERLLAGLGHETAPSLASADAVVLNTCAVTGESARKSRAAVRRARRAAPGALIALCGCFPQHDRERALALGADYVGGAGERRAVAEFIDRAARERVSERPVLLPDPASRAVFEALPVGSVSGRTRAFLKIQDGCENFCTYCVIPRLRGPSRSLGLADARRAALELAGEGYREIVLTGIEISSYGADIGSDLPSLVEAVAEGAGHGVRLRLGSLEPRTVDRAFCGRLAALGTLCPHFHLSLQSGSAAVLGRMGRRYTPERFLESAALLRETFGDPALTTDVICGFPGETEDEFCETLKLLRAVGFSDVHAFPFSPRPGTPAARLPDAVPGAEKARRVARAYEERDRSRADYMGRSVGRTLDVLFETEADGVSSGHAENYLPVSVRGAGLRGAVRRVRIEGIETSGLSGVLAGEDGAPWA